MKKYLLYTIFTIIIIGLLLPSVLLLEIGAISLVSLVFFELISQKKELFPIGLIALSFAGGQWLISPIFTYHTTNNLFSMSVDETTYLSYTLIGYSLFFIGVMWGRRKSHKNITIQEAERYCKKMKRQYTILIISGALFMIIPIETPALLFFKELLSCLFFIGIIMRMYAIPDKSIFTMTIGLAYLLGISILHGMFHNLVIWSIFLTLTLFFIKGYALKRKFAIVLILLFCVSTLQSIKALYRSYTWENSYHGNKITLFVQLYYRSLLGEIEGVEEEDINARFNQGWIISRIYSQIPAKTDYQDGRTIIEAIEASFMPRIIFSDKKDSGVSSIKDFEEFTGYHLTASTSMGLSVWGEAYGNFGLLGGGMFMLLWGFMIAGLFNWMTALTRHYGYWIFFVPLIAFNLIKAEINILSVMNWTLKSLIFVFVIIYLLRTQYPNKDVISVFKA